MDGKSSEEGENQIQIFKHEKGGTGLGSGRKKKGLVSDRHGILGLDAGVGAAVS